MHTGFWWGNLREGAHLKDLGVDERIIFKWVLEKWDAGHGLDRSGSEQGQVAGSCKCGNKHLGFIECGEFLDWLRTC